MRWPGTDRAQPSGRDLAAVQFAISAVALILVVTTAGLFALHRVARDEALRDAAKVNTIIARSVISPQVDQAVLDGDPAAIARLDALVTGNVLGELIVRIKLWTPDGRIVYSDEHRLIGQTLTPSEELADVAGTATTRADLSDLAADENAFERSSGQLLEVYTLVTATDGTRLVAETVPGDRGARLGVERDLAVLPAGAASRPAGARTGPASRWPGGTAGGRGPRPPSGSRLLEQADHARKDERSRIAADLHDSVVQDLAGVAFDLAANADQVDRRTREELAVAFRHGADVSRASIASSAPCWSSSTRASPPALDLTRALPRAAPPTCAAAG